MESQLRPMLKVKDQQYAQAVLGTMWRMIATGKLENTGSIDRTLFNGKTRAWCFPWWICDLESRQYLLRPSQRLQTSHWTPVGSHPRGACVVAPDDGPWYV